MAFFTIRVNHLKVLSSVFADLAAGCILLGFSTRNFLSLIAYILFAIVFLLLSIHLLNLIDKYDRS